MLSKNVMKTKTTNLNENCIKCKRVIILGEEFMCKACGDTMCDECCKYQDGLCGRDSCDD